MYIPGRKFLLFFQFPVVILINMVYYIFVSIYCFSYINYTTKTTASIPFSVTCSRSFCRLFFTAPFWYLQWAPRGGGHRAEAFQGFPLKVAKCRHGSEWTSGGHSLPWRDRAAARRSAVGGDEVDKVCRNYRLSQPPLVATEGDFRKKIGGDKKRENM